MLHVNSFLRSKFSSLLLTCVFIACAITAQPHVYFAKFQIVPSICPGVGTWSQQAQPTAFDALASDNFGESVAISGDTVIVGSPDDDNSRGTDAGAIYIYTRSGTVWTLQQKLTASDGTESDSFGFSVSISGETVVVGAHHGLVGDAYVFTRSGTVWTEQQKLTPSDGAGTDEFGSSVSISGDTVVVGSRRDDNAGGSDAGAAYVFTRTGTVWTQQQKLTASDGAALDFFGFSASISGDTVIVGAYVDDHLGGFNAGSAYVFTRSGTVWTQEQKLTASDATSNDLFGSSVSISGDSVVVGAYEAGIPVAGASYVFTRSGTVWTQQQKLTASDGADNDAFGGGVSISGDLIVVGAYRDDTETGSAYIFSRSGSTWTEQQKLTASDALAGDQFGFSVAISGDTAIVGADLDDTTGGADAGSSYVFNQVCPTISGTVTYGNSIGNPVPPRFVKNVSLSSTVGSPAVGPVITGTPGTYTLTGFGAGSYTIKPTKPGGSNGAITSNDAARVAQGVVSSPGFASQNQRFAADTSGNGNVTSNDAALIARFAAGLTGTGNAGQWKFFVTGAPSPLPTPPGQTYDDSRTYASVTGSLTGEDYVAILVGEVSGNWNPATHPRPAGIVENGKWTVESENGGPERGIEVKLPQVAAGANKEIVVPVSVQGAADKGIISYELDLRYNPSVIQPLEDPVDVAGTVSRGLFVVANPHEPGLLRVVVYGPMPIDENGVLLNLRFTAVGAAGSISPLTFERIMFNEGEPLVIAEDGRVELF